VTDHGGAPSAGALGSAVLFCESCGRETMHRILRLDPTAGPAPRAVGGIARCRECRWTHPFLSAREPAVPVPVIVSKGSSSERRTVELAAAGTLRVGEPLPGVDPGLVVHRIDRHDGARAPSALAREAKTVWAIVPSPPTLRVAVMEGARSATERVTVAPGLRLGIGDELRVPGGPVTIVALRARERTWRRPGDTFAAAEVAVVYGRRTVSPPAGRSPWSRGRGTARSRASSTSRVGRSRSSPGERRKRTVPRASIAARGATARNSSSS